MTLSSVVFAVPVVYWDSGSLVGKVWSDFVSEVGEFVSRLGV